VRVHDLVRLRGVIDEYGRMRRMDGYTAQSRGRRFNEVIAEMLRCWGLDADVSVRSAGEIDVAFAVGGVRYVLEAKWEQAKTDTGHIAKLQKRVRQRLVGTYGIFLSMAGYSRDALTDVAHGERLELLLLDAGHFEAMLSGLVPPQEMLSLVQDRASFRGEAYTPLLALLTPPRYVPEVEFGSPEAIPDSVVRSAMPGVSVTILLSVTDSRQLGVAWDAERLLVTTERGIIQVTLANRTVARVVPIRDCHRNPLILGDDAVLFARRHGVGRFHNGQLTLVGGGFAGNTCLLRHPDGSGWVFDNGAPDDNPGTCIARLGDQLGDQALHDLDHPPATASNAVWLTGDHLLIIGPFLAVTSLSTGETRRHRAAQSNAMGIVSLGGDAVLTAGDAVTLGCTDVRTGEYREVAQLDFQPSVNELVIGPDGGFFLAAYYQDGGGMSFAVARILLPAQLTRSASVPTRIVAGNGEPAANSAARPAKQQVPVPTRSGPVSDPLLPAADPRPQEPHPALGAVPWNVTQTERGNQDGAYATFHAYRHIYWVIVGLNTALVLLLLLMIATSELPIVAKIISGVVGIFLTFITYGYVKMAKSPVRLEIGAQGLQVFARRETAWIPWEVIERVDVVRVQGHQCLVAWCEGADMFPEFDSFGGGPRYLPKIGAIAVCPLTVLHARRHQIVRALRAYGGRRVGRS
jgi:hypothetical protein